MHVQLVGMRACYLFSRLVKVLRQNLRPLLPDLLVRLQPHLVRIASTPLPDTAPTAKGAQGIFFVLAFLYIMHLACCVIWLRC